MERKCENCEFWHDLKEECVFSSKMNSKGECRRKSPQASIGLGGERWSRTKKHEWCGEFKPKE